MYHGIVLTQRPRRVFSFGSSTEGTYWTGSGCQGHLLGRFHPTASLPLTSWDSNSISFNLDYSRCLLTVSPSSKAALLFYCQLVICFIHLHWILVELSVLKAYKFSQKIHSHRVYFLIRNLETVPGNSMNLNVSCFRGL